MIMNASLAELMDAVARLDSLAKESRLKSRKLIADFLLQHPNALKQARGATPQKAVAEAAGVQQSYISDVENGDTGRVSEDALKRVLMAYVSLAQGISDGSDEGVA